MACVLWQVVDGSGYAVVVRTGDATLIGSMVELTGDVGKNQSTLKADVELFVILITKFALVQAAVIFTVGVIRGISPLEAFVNGFISKNYTQHTKCDLRLMIRTYV